MAPSTDNHVWKDKDGSSPPPSFLSGGDSSSIGEGGCHTLAAGTWSRARTRGGSLSSSWQKMSRQPDGATQTVPSHFHWALLVGWGDCMEWGCSVLVAMLKLQAGTHGICLEAVQHHLSEKQNYLRQPSRKKTKETQRRASAHWCLGSISLQEQREKSQRHEARENSAWVPQPQET